MATEKLDAARKAEIFDLIFSGLITVESDSDGIAGWMSIRLRGSAEETERLRTAIVEAAPGAFHLCHSSNYRKTSFIRDYANSPPPVPGN